MTAPEPTGACRNCDDPLYDGRRLYCDDTCKAEHHSAHRALADEVRNVVAGPSPELLRAVREAVELNAVELEAYGEDRRGEGSYRSVSFELTRVLRAQPELRDLPADAAADAIEPVLVELIETGSIERAPLVEDPCDRTDPNDPWTSALGNADCFGNPMDAAEDLLKLWEILRPEPGLHGAVAEARRDESGGRADDFGATLASPRYAGRRLFLRVCRVLADWSAEADDPGVFALALEPLARELGWHRRTVGDWRAWAEREGYLERVSEPAKGAAARYRIGPRDRRLDW